MKGMIIEGALFCLCLMLVFGFFILKPEMGKPSLLSKKAGTTGTEMIETESSQSEETESDFGKAAPGDRIDANTLVQLIAQAKTIQTDSASQEDAALLKQAIEEAEKAVNSEIDEKKLEEISLSLVFAMGNF